MRIPFANLLLLGAAIAAPVEERRSKEVEHDDYIARGLISIAPRRLVPPTRPATPDGPVEPLPAPVRPGADPVAPPVSPGGPLRGPNEPEPVSAPLRPEPAPKTPQWSRPIKNCGLKRGECLAGTDTSLGIDANYKRDAHPLEASDTEIPKEPYIKEAGLDGKDSQWSKATIDNSRDTRARFEAEIIPQLEKKYDPTTNKDSPFTDLNYEEFIGQQRAQFGINENFAQPFIQTKNDHVGGTMVIEQMFKERDLFNECRQCVFDIGLGKTTYDRPPLPRKNGENEVPAVYTSQMLSDNWRVSAARMKNANTKNINNFAMNNVDTGASRDIFARLFGPHDTDITFQAGATEFTEVERTVQAKVIKRMLDSEKPTYGSKRVTEHRVFKAGAPNNPTWHMVSKLEEVSEETAA
ncbi:hypothetical protein K458DRAFT_397170 [Lentithecium fluviatile CBS 122367]|uniref:Uncharacterized protein n=1 Tax=Lentithecium fluviatile CBS 122367 TaxID=1168545 RepID=A0A6G1IDI7_9PLEO|nr:hypothetical protein K458DRAFT_397170 [Lentithecium fluviatile CBS 122367]